MARCRECNLKISKDEDGSAMPCPCGDGQPIQPSECDHYWVDSNVDGVLFCVICHADKCVVCDELMEYCGCDIPDAV